MDQEWAKKVEDAAYGAALGLLTDAVKAGQAPVLDGYWTRATFEVAKKAAYEEGAEWHYAHDVATDVIQAAFYACGEHISRSEV